MKKTKEQLIDELEKEYKGDSGALELIENAKKDNSVKADDIGMLEWTLQNYY